MESGFNELLPPKLKGFIIKRQAKLTMTKRSIYISTYQRGDSRQTKMVDALNRLDQTDALVGQILGAHMNQRAMRRRIRLKPKLSLHPNRTTIITTKRRRTQRVISWIGDPERIDDDGYPLVDENGSTLVPVPREGPLEEDEASSLTAWAQGYRDVRKNLPDSVTGRGYYKPESSLHKKVVRKTIFEKKPPRPRPKHSHSIPRQSERSQHRTCNGAELRKRTPCYRCRQLGHMARVCQNPASKDTLNLQPRISFYQEMLLHSCIIYRLTCCTMVHPRLLRDATLI